MGMGYKIVFRLGKFVVLEFVRFLVFFSVFDFFIVRRGLCFCF